MIWFSFLRLGHNKTDSGALRDHNKILKERKDSQWLHDSQAGHLVIAEYVYCK